MCVYVCACVCDGDRGGKEDQKKSLWKERVIGSEDKEGQLSSHLIKKLLMEQTGRHSERLLMSC